MFMFFTFIKRSKRILDLISDRILGHANAEEAFHSIQAVHGKLDLTHNLVQVSMGGPHVNWKTVEIIQEY